MTEPRPEDEVPAGAVQLRRRPMAGQLTYIADQLLAALGSPDPQKMPIAVAAAIVHLRILTEDITTHPQKAN